MDMVSLRPSFVEVFLALHVHQVQFVNQAVALEQTESAVDGDAVNAGIEAAGLAKNLSGVKVLLGCFYHGENSAPLVGHAQPARHQFRLQASRSFSLRQGHGGFDLLKLKPSCNRLSE